MAPYPITVAGLVAQVNEADRYIEYRAALLDIRRRLLALPRPAVAGTSMRGTRARPAMAPAVVLAVKLVDELVAGIDALPAFAAVVSAEPAPFASPVFVPDAVNPRVIRDAGTGQPVNQLDAGIVPWWPVLQAATIAAGVELLTDVTTEGLDLGHTCEYFAGTVQYASVNPGRVLVAWAQTRQLIAGAAAGHDRAARYMRGGGSRARRAARQSLRDMADTYAGLVTWLDGLGNELVARFGAYLTAITARLTAALDMQRIDMPTLTGSSAVVSTLATRIRDAITSGHGGRLQVSDQEQAFAWSPALPSSLLTYLATSPVTGRRTTVVTAKNAATVVGPVAEGGAKPDVVEFDERDLDLKKYPGQATLSVESSQFVRNIETAVAQVIAGQIVRAIEVDAVAEAQANDGVVITGATDITAGVLSAIAQLRSGGANPNVVALAADDWVAIMQATGAAGYLNFSNPEAGPAGTWLGLAPVIVPSLTVGSAVVLDGSAVGVQEPAGGPLCLVDCWTLAKNNRIVITIESWARAAVSSPGGVATVAVTAGP